MQCEMDLEIDIKEEPVWLDGTANTSPMSNLLLPSADKLAEVKIEPQHVFADQILEGAGVSLVKEENELKDVKKETHDEAYNPLADTVHDGKIAAILAGGTVHPCVKCSKIFSQKSALNRHLTTHTRANPYCCEICNCTFSLKDALRKHLLTHSATRPFECSTCGDAFRKMGNLKRHQCITPQTSHLSSNFRITSDSPPDFILHNDSKSLSCSECSYVCSSSGELRKHEALLSKTESLLCWICGKSFKKPSELRRHENTHSNNRPFCCSICGNSFKSASDLRTHGNIHGNSSRPFCCSVCGCAFKKSSDLRRHEKTYTETNSFTCSICGNRFRRPSDLRRHENTHIEGRSSSGSM